MFTQGSQCQYLLTDIDKCSITPTICGHGLCVPVQTGYTCYCDPGYKLSALQTNCIGKTGIAGWAKGASVSSPYHCLNTSLAVHTTYDTSTEALRTQEPSESDPCVYVDPLCDA